MKKQKLKVVSYNFDNNPAAEKLVRSCQVYGYDLSFIGVGQGFKNFRQAKIELLLSELKNVDATHIMYTDGLDSWFLRDDLFDVYDKYFSGVVISGNRNHYPSSDLYDFYPISESSFQYICSSQFIGPKEELISILELMLRVYQGYTDQEGWNLLYARNLAHITVDDQCRLFLNMTNVSMDEVTDTFLLKETRKRPCSIHFGGPKGDDPNAIMMTNLYELWVRKNS